VTECYEKVGGPRLENPWVCSYKGKQHKKTAAENHAGYYLLFIALNAVFTTPKNYIWGFKGSECLDVVFWFGTFFGTLIYDVFSVTRLYSVDDRVTSEWWIDENKHLCLKDLNSRFQRPSHQGLRPGSRDFWSVLLCSLVGVTRTLFGLVTHTSRIQSENVSNWSHKFDRRLFFMLRTTLLYLELYLGISIQLELIFQQSTNN
jgi:hypothetical protein